MTHLNKLWPLLGLLACQPSAPSGFAPVEPGFLRLGSCHQAPALLDVQAEARRIDVGTQDGRLSLHHGWYQDEHDGGGTTYAWSGRSAQVSFWLDQPKRVKLRMRLRPAPPLLNPAVTVVFNDVQIARQELRQGLATYAVALPKAQMRRGRNILRLNSDTAIVPAVHDSSSRDHRSIAFAWDWLEFSGLGDKSPASDGRDLWLPQGASASLYLQPGQADAVVLHQVQPTGGQLELWWHAKDRLPNRLASFAEPQQRVRVPVPKVDGPAQLTLRVSAGAATVRGVCPSTWPEPKDNPPLTTPSVQAPPNVILYVVDTLRRDRLSVYGHNRPTSPNLDAFARNAIVFERATVPAPWTRPAMASMLTGLGPERHGVNGVRSVLPQAATTLAEALEAAGYRTGAVVGNSVVGKSFGFGQGFNAFREHRGRTCAGKPKDCKPAPWPAATDLLADAKKWLGSNNPSKPFFLWLHTTEPHSPFTPAKAIRQRWAGDIAAEVGTTPWLRSLQLNQIHRTTEIMRQLHDVYDAEVAEADEAFGLLLQTLEDLDLTDNTIVIFVSDHGEEFFEHQNWSHRQLYSEVIDVPLLIGLPQPQGPALPARIKWPVSVTDLMPTVLALAGIPSPEGLTGHNLLPYLNSASVPERMSIGRVAIEGQEAWSLETNTWRALQRQAPDRRRQLFHRGQDPRDLNDLSSQEPILTGLLLQELFLRNAQSRALPTDRVAEDSRAIERMRALGYVH